MPNFTPDELERMLDEVLDCASAPRQSAKWRNTAEVVKPLYERGDAGDHYVFMTGLANSLVFLLGIDRIGCPCGDPDHRPKKIFLLRPEDPSREIPAEVAAFTELVTAEANDDEDASMAVFAKAARGGYGDRMLAFAMTHVGDELRSAVAMGRGN